MDLSILIPARNEEFLQKTVDDVLAHAEGDTEVIVGLDGWFTELKRHPRLQYIHVDKSMGQRAMTNALARLSQAKYVMKLDAHCSMSQGFDVQMMKDMEDDVTMVPALGNLHAYDWVCPKRHKHFQGKYEACEQCGSTELTKDVTWQIIPKPIMSSFCFDTGLHFQYSKEQSEDILSESMSIQGSCFMATRERYFTLNLCDEAFGSWGQQGTEVACKTWLSGGRVLSTKKAFYGHQFRETEGFPYHNPVEKIFYAQSYSRDMFLGNKWPMQTRSIQWLIEKFGYQFDWTPEEVEKRCAVFDTTGAMII